jgi:hypothetical protein
VKAPRAIREIGRPIPHFPGLWGYLLERVSAISAAAGRSCADPRGAEVLLRSLQCGDRLSRQLL